jgi:hypothetical protein
MIALPGCGEDDKGNADCDEQGWSSVDSQGGYDTTDTAAAYYSRHAGDEPTAVLEIQFGPTDGPFSGDFTADLNCGNLLGDYPCAIVCDGAEHVDPDLWDTMVGDSTLACARILVAISGSLTIETLDTTAGGTIRGILKDVKFVEADLGAEIPDGKTWCIDHFQLETDVRVWP